MSQSKWMYLLSMTFALATRLFTWKRPLVTEVHPRKFLGEKEQPAPPGESWRCYAVHPQLPQVCSSPVSLLPDHVIYFLLSSHHWHKFIFTHYSRRHRREDGRGISSNRKEKCLAEFIPCKWPLPSLYLLPSLPNATATLSYYPLFCLIYLMASDILD